MSLGNIVNNSFRNDPKVLFETFHRNLYDAFLFKGLTETILMIQV